MNKHVGKKGISDYLSYIGTRKQASNFEISSKFIINYIKQTFYRGKDVAESSQNTAKWKPKLADSKATDKKTEIMKINKLSWNSNQTSKNVLKEQQYIKKICSNCTLLCGKSVQRAC